MTIHIENLLFRCIIGILDFERKTEQDVIVNLELQYNYKEQFINYADVTDFIKNEMIEHKFMLIEEALEYLITQLKIKFPLILHINLKITKPSILPDTMVSVSDSKLFDS